MTGFHVHHVAKSSNVKTIAYNGSTLRVTFKGGATYNVADVPEHVHKEFLASESKGGYYAKFIMDNYKVVKHEEST